MSRGPGLLMRRVVEELKKVEGKTRTRRELEEALCPQGFRSDNILRAVRTLAAMHAVGYAEGRFADDSRVSLPQPLLPLTNEQLDELLALLEKPE